MFKKLRLKLTLINVVIMALLFLLFTIGTFFAMQTQLFNQSNKLMQMIAASSGSGASAERGRNRVNYFVIKTNQAGNITDFSSDISLNRDELGPLAREILERHRVRGEIIWRDEHYTYLRVDQNNNYMLVFVNVEKERDFLGFLLVTLSVIGVGSLVLVFYGSLFLANKAMKPIQKSWQRQKDFVADASHELRTPLAVIQTNLELVRGNEEESVRSQSHWLENIELETKRLTKLVEDLLFLARADSNQQLFDMKYFPLNKAFAEALNPVIPLAQGKSIEFEMSLGPETVVYGDENRLKQLVIILVDNALKHTPAGGRIGVKMLSENNFVRITVWDSGEGVPPEHIGKIFERFYRVDKSRARQEGGSGLGLSIAEWIVQSHGGSIQVASIPDQGSIFTIVLPRTKEFRKKTGAQVKETGV